MPKALVLPLPILVLTPILLLAILLSAACGGGNGSNGEPLPLEEYFQTLAKANASLNQRAENVEVGSGPPSVEDSRSCAEEFGVIVDDFINSLKGVTPPAEVKSQHDKLMEAATEVQTIFSDFSDKLDKVESLGEAAPIMEQFGINIATAGGAEESACRALQSIAVGKGFEIDLECES